MPGVRSLERVGAPPLRRATPTTDLRLTSDARHGVGRPLWRFSDTSNGDVMRLASSHAEVSDDLPGLNVSNSPNVGGFTKVVFGTTTGAVDHHVHA